MKYAFSLVELSIVLVILGLLTGGILSGQSLIRASELRSVINDFQRFNSAFYSFRDKYFSLPGDMPNAVTFWGSAGGNGSDVTCQNTASTDAKTCNGTGDGQIESNAVVYGERFRAWQHMANAGLIEGAYTGRDGAATAGDGTDPNFNKPGINVPRGKMSNSLFIINYLTAVSGDVNWFDTSGGWNHIAIGGTTSNPLKPEEGWNIDTKLDDGLPATGRIYTTKASGPWNGGCATSDTLSAAWNLANSTSRCTLWYALK